MRVPVPVAVVACAVCLGAGYALKDPDGAAAPAAATATATAPADSAATPRSAAAAPGVQAGPEAATEAATEAAGLEPAPTSRAARGDRAPRPSGAARDEVAVASDDPPGLHPPRLRPVLGPPRLPDLDLADPRSASVLRAYADYLFGLGRKAEAVLLLRSAAALHPSPALLAGLVQLDAEAGLETYAEALERTLDDALVANLYGIIATGRVMRSPSRPRLAAALDRVRPRTLSVYQCLAVLDPARAVAAFRADAADCPEPLLFKLLSQAALDLGDRATALAWGLRANELAPELSPPTPETDEELRALEALVSADPRRLGVRLALVTGYLSLGKADALRARAAVWARTLDADELSALGWTASDSDPATAALFFEPAVRARPHDRGLLEGMAEAAPEQALKLFEELARDDRATAGLLHAIPRALEGLATSESPQRLLPWLARVGHRVDAEDLGNLTTMAFDTDPAVAERLHAYARSRYPGLPSWEERRQELAPPDDAPGE